jgi:hypothetical protein
MARYVRLQNRGRHGSVNDTNAVGRRWTKAVAINTPVPKCLEMKRNRRGIGRPGNRRARTGNEQAAVELTFNDADIKVKGRRGPDIPNVLSPRIKKRAMTWSDVL